MRKYDAWKSVLRDAINQDIYDQYVATIGGKEKPENKHFETALDIVWSDIEKTVHEGISNL